MRYLSPGPSLIWSKKGKYEDIFSTDIQISPWKYSHFFVRKFQPFLSCQEKNQPDIDSHALLSFITLKSNDVHEIVW